MNAKPNKQRNRAGFTLVEILVVVAIIAIMISLTVPATSTMVRSYRQASAKSLVRSAMAQAQAYAVKERKYAGLRFQKDGSGQQYIILVENKAITLDNVPFYGGDPYPLKNLYAPVDNVRPITLPVGIEVMPAYREPWEIDFLPDNGDGKVWPGDGDGIIDYTELAAATTFCVLFDPSGQLVRKPAQCGPRLLPAEDYPGMVIDYNEYINNAYDDTVFANNQSVLPSEGLPLPGDVIQLGFTGVKLSQSGVYMYENNTLERIPANERLWYISTKLEPMLINIYTGEFLENEQDLGID